MGGTCWSLCLVDELRERALRSASTRVSLHRVCRTIRLLGEERGGVTGGGRSVGPWVSVCERESGGGAGRKTHAHRQMAEHTQLNSSQKDRGTEVDGGDVWHVCCRWYVSAWSALIIFMCGYMGMDACTHAHRRTNACLVRTCTRDE